MVTYLRQWIGRTFRVVAAGVLLVTFVFCGLPGVSDQVMAAPKGTLPETLDLTLTKAAQDFVETVLDDYADALDDAFGDVLKPLKSVSKDLTKQLGKATADPAAVSATTLGPKVDSAKVALATAAAAFDGLVTDTNTFKATLATAPTQLKAALDTQMGPKFDELQTALVQVSEAIALLSQDTAALDAADPAAAAAPYTEHATQLTTAIESAKMAIAALGESDS
jgi:hypothetical protein